MALEPFDYVEHGIGRLPDLYRTPTNVKYLSVYLQETANSEVAALQVINALLEWNGGGRTFSFVLDIIGKLIGQPRPNNFDDDDYRFVLVARTIARVSDSTYPSVLRLVHHLARGSQYSVIPSVPEHWKIVFFDLDLDAQWLAIYARLLLDTIGATDSLEIIQANGGVALYDTDNVGYDQGVYAP